MVIYESMFGDNQQVARAIAAGLAQAGVQTEAIEVGNAPSTITPDVDLLVVGSPNHGWSLPRPSTRQDAATKSDTPLVSQGIGVREWLGGAALHAGATHGRLRHPRVAPQGGRRHGPRLDEHRKGPGETRRDSPGTCRALSRRRRQRPTGARRTGTRPRLGHDTRPPPDRVGLRYRPAEPDPPHPRPGARRCL